MRSASALALALLLCVPATLAAQPAMTSVSGTVLDPTGTGIGGAHVQLILTDGTQVQSSTADATGDFRLNEVRPGSYLVTVAAGGFAPFTTNPFTVTAQRSYALPRIVLPLAEFSTSVVVRPTEVVAAEQIKAQEKQRLLGFVPNFYVSYVPDAAPMTSRQKFSLAAHETFDWTAFVGASVAAATDQAAHAYAGFGTGASGYAKRWAANFADDRTGDLLDHYVFASLFHQDPRYFYQGTGTTKSRIAHAVTSAFVARSDTGRPMPNFAYLFGNVSAAVLSNTYYPHAQRGAGLILTNVAIGLAGRASAALMQEFVGRHLTKHVPDGHRPASQ